MRSYNFGKGCKVELHGHGKPIMEIVQEKVAEMELKVSKDLEFLDTLERIVSIILRFDFGCWKSWFLSALKNLVHYLLAIYYL